MRYNNIKSNEGLPDAVMCRVTRFPNATPQLTYLSLTHSLSILQLIRLSSLQHVHKQVESEIVHLAYRRPRHNIPLQSSILPSRARPMRPTAWLTQSKAIATMSLSQSSIVSVLVPPFYLQSSAHQPPPDLYASTTHRLLTLLPASTRPPSRV
jgi:hypothetical protein